MPSPQHAITAARFAASKANQSFRLRSAPLRSRDLAVAVRVEAVERMFQTRRHEQRLQVLVAAVAEEFDHFIVILYRVDDLSLAERPAAVRVDHVEDLSVEGALRSAE